MKTFETEKNNIPEVATHYSEECAGKYFCWYAVTEDDAKICVLDGRGFGYKWHKCTNEHYGCDVKPIPKPEVVEWKNGDECVYRGEVYAYQCVASWDSDACILSGKSRNAESLIDAWIDELSKPESPEEKEKRERLEGAYDLYCDAQYSVDAIVHDSFEEFKSDKVQVKFWLAIVDKTNYRKGE